MTATQRSKTRTSFDRALDTQNLPAKASRLAMLRQLAKAIDEASARGSPLGDLAPHNIFVSGDASAPKVEVALSGSGNLFVPEEEFTSRGTIPESARYLPPERILGTSTDVRSYEFSLAVIAYELICGTKPFDASDLQELFYRVCNSKPIPAGEVDRSLTPAVGAVLNRALGKQVEQRYPDCTTFIDALAASLRNCPGWTSDVVDGELPPVPEPPPAALYTASSTRIRRRYGEEPEENFVPASGSRSGRRYGIIAALCLALIGLMVIRFYKPKPNLPVQVLDTNAGPASAPPETPPVVPPKHVASQPVPKVERKTAAAPPREKPSTLIVPETDFLTDPTAAEIVVDNDPSKTCATPCTLPLPRGRHTLTASLGGFTRAQRIFSVPQDKSLFISLSRQVGTLVVTSTPSGLPVLIDGREVGQTPATLHLAPGEHQLVLINGTARHGETINVEGDAIQAKSINW